MSIDPKKSKLSAIKGVDPVSEEAFGWVVVDQSPVQRQSDTDDGAAQVSNVADNAEAGTSKFVVSADALARIMSVEDQPAPNALHGAEAPVQRQHSDSGASLFNSGFGVHGLSIPAHAGLTTNRGSSNTITAVPGARPGEVAGHIATGSSVQGPSVAALAAIGREDHPLALHISAVDALHHRGTVDLVVTGMPPGAILTHGHSGPNHSWILPHNTDLTSLSLIPTPDWSGSGTLHITGTQTNGSTANAVLPFQIGPLPDGAIIGGIATGSTIEDTKTSVSGDLTVVDPDSGEASFVSHSYTLGHGVLAIDSAGHWTFNLDNNSAAVQSLAVGEVIHEMVAVQTVDGTSHSISLTISGRNDGPVLSGSVASAVEDGAPVSGQMVATDADRGDQLAFAAVGPLPAGLTVNGDGSWTFDPGQSAYQSLGVGSHQVLSVPVTVTDGHGGSDRQDLVITVVGSNDGPHLANAAASMAENQPILRGQLAATDVDSGDQLRFTAGSLPVGFSISNSGAWSYAPPSGMYDDLRVGETTDLVVPVTVRDPSGASDGRNLIVTIKGTNDKPVVSGTFVGQVKEDRTLRSTGSLQITDADHGEDHFLSGSQVGSYGTLKINASGDWSYDLDNNNRDVQGLHTSDQIVDKFTISTADGSTRQILVTVNGTDDGAQITGVATGSVTEDGTTVAKGKLTVLDPDKGDNQLVPQTGASGAFGAFTVGADGAWSYQVDNGDPSVQGLKSGDALADHITVSSVDGTTHQIQITIHGTNDAPALSAATASATEDGNAVSGQMSATDVDSGDTQKFTLGQAAPAGFVLNADGSWSFDPTDAAYQHLAAGATQDVTVPVTVTDSAGGTDTQNLVITVTGSNDGPAVSGPVTLPGGTEDTAVQITAAQLLDHATDIDTGDQLSVTGLSASHGVISGDAATGFTFTPDANYNGPVSLSYQVTDGHGGTIAQTASLTLAATGDAAVIGGVDTGSVTENTAGQDMSPDYAQPGMAHLGRATLNVSGQLTIFDPDAGEAEFDTKGLGFTYSGQYGDMLLNADGSWHYHADAGNVRSTGGFATTRGTAIDQLGVGQTLTDTITVHSKDGTPHDIVVTIHGSNDRPYCSAEVVLRPGTEDTRQTLTSAQLLQNTVDVDANDAGKHSIANLHPDHGSILDNKDGTFTFTPDKDYNGAVHFTYDVKDAHGGVTHTGATTNLAAVGDAAVITGTDTGTATEDKVAGRIVISGNLDVTDPDGPTQEHFRFSQFGEHAILDPYGGNLHIDSGGVWSYVTDNSNAAIQRLAAGEVGHATYRVASTDGTTHQIQITIHGTNDAPVLSAATASATEDGIAVSGQMHATDVDSGDTQKFTLGQAAPAGFALNADGSWSFDPTDAAYQHLAVGATQDVTVPVTVTDSAGATDTENLVITVTGTNDGPAVSGPVTLPGGTEDTAVQITAAQLLDHATDIDTGDQLSVTGLSASHGVISGDAANGFTFTPDANYNGPVSLSYQVTDGHGGTVAETASLTLVPVGDQATFSGQDTGTVTEDHISGMQWLRTSGHLDITDPDKGEAHFVGNTRYQPAYPTSLGGLSSLVIGPKGDWVYIGDNSNPRVQALGSGDTLTDTAQVRSADGTTHQIQITIHGTNDAPVLSAATASATEDGNAVSGQMSATDVDSGDTQKFTLGQAAPAGFVLNADGSWSFDPTDAAYQHLAAGATQDVTVPVTVTDSAGATDTENLVITVTGTNDGPAVSGPVTLPGGTEDTAVQITTAQLLDHATDIDTGDQLSVTGLSASHGVISGDAATGFTFTPDANYNGPVSLSYQVTDGHGGTVAQTAALTLGATSDAAVITGTGASLKEDVGVGTTPGDRGLLSAYGQFHVVDPDGVAESRFPTPQIGGLYTGSLGGHLQVNPDGQYIYHVANSSFDHLKTGEEAKDHFVIHSVDGTTHPVEFTIAGTNDAPVVYRNLVTKFEGEHVFNGHVSAGDLDHDDSATLKFTSGAPVAGFHLNSDGSYSFDPSNAAYNYLNNGDHTIISIPITVTDSDGLNSTGSLRVQLLGNNDAPVLSSATASATEDGNAVTGQMSATDVDGSSFEQQYSLGQTAPAGFSLSVNGSWSFDPTDAAYQHLAVGVTQDVTIPVTVTDKQGATDTENLVITVTGTNDGPVFAHQVTDLGATAEDTPRTFSEAQLISLMGVSDVDGDALHVSAVTVNPHYGAFSHQPNGDWLFTPAPDQKGDNIPIGVTVTDGTTTQQGAAILDLTTVTDAAKPDLTISAEQQVMEFDNSSASAIFTREAVHNGGPISSMALEMTVLGGQQVASAGVHGATLVSYETSPNSDQMYVYKPDDMVVRIAGHNYDTQVAVLNDGKDHRYSFLWDGPKGTLDVLIDGQVAKHMDNVAKGLTMPDGGALAFGGDQDSMRGGFDNNDAFAGKMFNAAMATSTVSPSQLATAPLAQVLDGQPSLLTAVQISNGQIVDRTGNYHYDIHGSFTHTTVEVDTKIAPPNPGATLKLTASLGAPSDSDDHIVHARLSGFPTGTVITDGTSAHSVTISANTPDVDIAGWNISGLTAHAPASFHGNFRTTLVVVTQGPDGTQATATTSAPVIFDATQPVPDAKISGDSSATTDEDTSVSGNLTIVDSAGQDHFVAATLSGTLGELQIQQNGHWTYTPGAKADAMAEGAKAYESFMVKSADGSQHEVHISLQGTNDAPVVTATQSAPADLGEVSTGKTLSFTDAELIQLTGATDIEHEALSVSSVTVDPQYGAFSKAPGGGWTFTPASGAAHEDVVVQIAVSDGHTVTDASGTLDVGFALAVTAISQDTGVSSTDFTTTDNTLVFSGEGIPGHTIYSMLGGGQVTVDPNGHWQIDLTAYSRTPGDYNFKFFDMESKATLSQRVTITHEHPVLVIDNVGGDDLIDSGDHGKPINVTGDAHNVLDGSIVDLEIAGTHYSATVQGGHWTVTVPGSDMSKLADQNLLLNGVLTDVGGGTATAQHHLVVAADPLSLHASVDLKEDAIVTAMGQVFPGQQVGSVNHPGTYQGNFGTLTVSADGLYTYTLDNGAKSIQALLSGTNARDNFLIPITEASGQTHSAIVAVNIEGTDDAPMISGTLEAERAIKQGAWTNLNASGHLDVTDADSQSLSVTINGQTWVPGTAAHIDTPSARLSIDPNGDWTYSLVHAGPQQDALFAGARAGIPQHETFDIIATDGEGHIAKEQLVVTVAPDGQDFTLRGEMRAAVTEDVVTSTTGHLDPVGPTGILDETQTYVWAVAPSQSGDHGNFTVDAHGNWHYALDTQNPEVQALGQGDILQDHATIVATDSTGKQISREVTVDVAGSNDVAVVGGHHVGAVTEDGTPIVTGQLVGTDVDKGDTVTFDAQSVAVGTYGTFDIASDGHWTYHLNNQIAATQQLSGGQVETETFTVTARSTDGAIIHQKISVNVSGHEDAPVISGAFSGSVTEDSSSHASATGQVTASDADSGDKPIFVAQSAVIGTYGTFSIDEHGTWNYDLDNSNAATQALNSGSIEHETFQISVHTADGETVTHDVQIEVHGTDEGAILPPPPPPPIPVVAQSDDVDAPPAVVDVDLSIASDLPDLPELSPYLVAAGLQNAPSNVGESGPDDTSDPYLGALGVHRSSPVEPHLIDDPTLLNADLDPDGVSDNEEGHSEPLPEIVDDPLDDLPPPDPIIDENT